MSKTKEVENNARRLLSRLQIDNPESKANLARLRRAAGKPPEETPDVWSFTLDELPEELSGYYKDGRYFASDAEWAIHNALTLYSIHAQGASGSPQKDGVSFGKAVGKLSKAKDGEDAIKKRFSKVITSSDKTEITNHLRSIVQLMRNEDAIGLDYALLAKDLYLVAEPEYRDSVFFNWGEDFYSSDRNDLKENREE